MKPGAGQFLRTGVILSFAAGLLFAAGAGARLPDNSRQAGCAAGFHHSHLVAVRIAQAPTLPEPAPGTVPQDAKPDSPAPERRLLRLNGKPALMLLARGVKDSFDLGMYRELGFNTVLIDVPWQTPVDYDAADAMLRSAHRLGLAAVVQVHPGEPPAKLHLRIDPADPSYARLCTEYLKEVAGHFRAADGMGALMLEDDAEQHVQDDDAGFRGFLAQHYPTIASLNADWGTNFNSAAQITMDGAVRTSFEQYGGMAAPCLMVGQYRSQAYRSLLHLWSATLAEADAFHPVLAGRQDLPRSAVETPRLCAGLVVAASAPDVLPVDIGRRAGQFVTIVSLPAGDAQNEEVVRPFLMDCLVHGAGGVIFPSWPSLAANRQAREEVRTLLHDLSATAGRLRAPSPGFAVVYEPLAPGTQEGGMAAPFGFMPQPADREPGTMMQVLSHGSIFGFADVLSVDDLVSLPLSRYRVLWMPSAFEFPPEALQAVSQFVKQGGIVVTDLGLDLADLRRLEAPWPNLLADVFGITGADPIQFGLVEHPRHSRDKTLSGAYAWTPQAPKLDLFPEITEVLIHQIAATPIPFAPPRGFVQFRPGADLSTFGFNQAAGPDRASGIFLRQLGQGYLFFASFRLWSRWTPEMPLFALFHGDLLARGASSFAAMEGNTGASVRFTPTLGGGFAMLQAAAPDAIGRVRILEADVPLRRQGIVQALPGATPSTLVYTNLLSQKPVECDPVPVTVRLQTGSVTAALDEYGSRQIRFKICGSGASVKMERGTLHLVAGDAGEATITIHNGAYPILPGSRHVAVIQDLRPGGRTRTILLAAGADQTIFFSDRFTADSVSIRPAG